MCAWCCGATPRAPGPVLRTAARIAWRPSQVFIHLCAILLLFYDGSCGSSALHCVLGYMLKFPFGKLHGGIFTAKLTQRYGTLCWRK